MSIRRIDELTLADAMTAGGKASTLGWLRKLDVGGYVVPDGFVLTTDVFDAFFTESKLDRIAAKALAKGDDERASRAIREAIEASPFPRAFAKPLREALARLGAKRVAVRSSAPFEDGHTHSFAGQFESYLNVPTAKVVEHVKRCWASLFLPRAIAYLRVERPTMAVLVQAMAKAEKAGVAFSIHPVTADRTRMVVEATHGLGEAVVGGTITPDAYTLTKDTLRLVARTPGPTLAPVLDRRQLTAIGKVVGSLERAFEAPVDIEWALGRGEPQLVQCRPVTSGLEGHASSGLDVASLARIRWHYIHTRPRSPFFVHVFLAGFPELLNDIGVDYRVRHIGMFSNDVAMSVADWEAVGKRVSALRRADPEWPLRAIALCKKQHAEAQRRWRKLASRSYEDARPEVIARALESYVDDMLRFNAYVSWPPPMEGELTAEVKQLLAAKFGDEVDAIFATACDPVDSGIVTEEQIARLTLKASDKTRALEEHAERYGWMKNVGYFGDWYPPAHYARLVRREAPNAKKLLEETRADVMRKRRALAKVLRGCGDDAYLRHLLKSMNALVAFRSYRTELFYESYRYVRPILAAAAQRLRVSARDILHFFPDEIAALLRAEKRGSKELIAERKEAVIFVSDSGGRYFTLSGAAAKKAHPRFGGNDADASRRELLGQAAYAGVVRGRAVVIRDVSELSRLKTGDVLVAHATNIDFVSALHRVAAIVTEEGGILCHAAVVSRELRIPAVIGTGDATRVLRTGDHIEVDGARGVVRMI